MVRRKVLGFLAALAALLFSGPAAAAPRLDDLFSVTFPTAQEGWACGRWGTIVHTRDGGATWARQTTGTDYTLTSISFVDARNGWAVGDGGTILRTTDGGSTWEKQKSPVPYFLMGVQFVTKEKGWIVTERTHILATTDGGKTWAVQFQDQDFILKSVSFCDEQNGWAAGEYGFIYRTADGGRSWQRQAGEFNISDETGEVVGGNFLFDITAIDPKTAWAVGIDGYAAKTADGGKTWQAVKGLPKTHLFGVRTGPQGVAVVGDATLLLTSDGGATWRPVQAEPSIRYGWLYRLARRADQGFVAVGQGGWIYVSDAKATSSRLARR
ncbi:MAG: hypothetical protein HY900_32745 [Deltaproteobacteria bacterium]|nr:hypothetical protein [Deltaproteobacteria bacterium]